MLENNRAVKNFISSTTRVIKSPSKRGMRKVRIPNAIPCFLYLESSSRLISRPVRNIRYNNPTVPNSVMPISFEIRLKPKGPRIIPDKINPTIPGIFNLLANSGEKRKKIRIIKNTMIGSLKGNFNSIPVPITVIFCSAIYSIFLYI